MGYEGSVFSSTDPAGGASAWSVTDANEGRGATHLTAVSCPSASLCVAVSGGYGEAAGTVLTSTDPASGRWQRARLGGSPDLRGVTSAWRAAGSSTPRDLQAVSCVAALLCVAGDGGGNILSSTEPTGGGSFAATNAAGSVQMTGLTCPTTSVSGWATRWRIGRATRS